MINLMKNFLIGACKSFAFLIILLIVLEIGYRFHIGASLKFIDFRSLGVLVFDQPSISMYDSEVGWITKPGHRSKGFNTKAFGFRAIGPEDEAVPLGGVLVVGNSFAAGSEVDDEFSWPAILQGIINKPVLNGAIGGYGVDQSVLRARQLIKSVKPKTIIVDVQLDSLLGVDFVSYGRPKPYFVLENGDLKRMNKPVPFLSGTTDARKSEKLRSYLAYSAVVDRVLSIFAAKWWYESAHGNFQRLNQDFVGVTCRILESFKVELDQSGIRLLVLIQYHGSLIDPSKGRYGDLDRVRQCINQKGIQTADEWDSLLAVAKNGPDQLKKYYVMQPDQVTYGHMSALGNALVARVLADALSKAPSDASDKFKLKQ